MHPVHGESLELPALRSAIAAKRFAESLLVERGTSSIRPNTIGLKQTKASSAQPLAGPQFGWLMSIAPTRARDLIAKGAAAEHAEAFQSPLTDALLEWDPSKHPRRGGPPNAGWFASKGGGGGGSGGTGGKRSILGGIVDRNRQIANLSGGPTAATIRAGKLAAEIESAARLPKEVASAFASGLKTGGKALINGGATAIKNVATLGLSTSQLELIGVTDEDRANGYDTAVAISTASGELLIAVGTGGVSSALSKGGSIARGASGALLVYDAAGNVVGVVQGSYDAATDGISIRNGAQIASGALGLTANIRAAANAAKPQAPKKSAVPEASAAEVDAFVQRLQRNVTPRKSPANLYEIEHTGPYNYRVSGGGMTFDIDGYRGSTILEAKHVGAPSSSPYVPNSSCYPPVREKVLKETRDELIRVRTIIESGETPFRSIEIITNTNESKVFFERLLKELAVPGTVRLASKSGDSR
jgi:hypothetical protein